MYGRGIDPHGYSLRGLDHGRHSSLVQGPLLLWFASCIKISGSIEGISHIINGEMFHQLHRGIFLSGSHRGSYSYDPKNLDLDLKNKATPPAKPSIKEPLDLKLKAIPSHL